MDICPHLKDITQFGLRLLLPGNGPRNKSEMVRTIGQNWGALAEMSEETYIAPVHIMPDPNKSLPYRSTKNDLSQPTKMRTNIKYMFQLICKNKWLTWINKKGKESPWADSSQIQWRESNRTQCISMELCCIYTGVAIIRLWTYASNISPISVILLILTLMASLAVSFLWILRETKFTKEAQEQQNNWSWISSLQSTIPSLTWLNYGFSISAKCTVMLDF